MQTDFIRSYLFVPGDDARKLEKSATSTADALIFDLEDAVALANKDVARTRVSHRLQQTTEHLNFVRVNDLSTGLTERDVAAVAQCQPYGYLLPKCESPQDIARLSGMIRDHFSDAQVRILAIVTETVKAVRNLARLDWADPSLFGLTWGGEDLLADLGATRNRRADGRYHSVFTYARDMTLLAAKDAGVLAVDAVFPDFRDDDGLRSEAREGFDLGFDGKMAIHPGQIAGIHAVAAPTSDQVERATRIVAAFADTDVGVAQLDGNMLDKPHLRAAQRVLKLAQSR